MQVLHVYDYDSYILKIIFLLFFRFSHLLTFSDCPCQATLSAPQDSPRCCVEVSPKLFAFSEEPCVTPSALFQRPLPPEVWVPQKSCAHLPERNCLVFFSLGGLPFFMFFGISSVSNNYPIVSSQCKYSCMNPYVCHVDS